MAQSPEELRREIEQTRENMGRDVDAISDKVSPSRIMHRKVGETKTRLNALGDRVMGTASSGGEKLSNTAGAAGTSLSDAVAGAPGAAMDRTQGNPLAAGLLAFAAGWLVSSLLPASDAEAQAAQAIEDKVKEPLKQELGDIAREVKDEVQGTAQEAAQTVKESATGAAQAVADQGRETAQNVGSQAKSAADDVRQTATDRAS
jgi:hypothetical protein